MVFVTVFVAILILAIVLLPFVNEKGRSVLFFSAVLLNAVFTSYFSIQTLLGQTFEVIIPGSLVTGPIALRMDALSGWFMLVINLVFITGGLWHLLPKSLPRTSEPHYPSRNCLYYSSLIAFKFMRNTE